MSAADKWSEEEARVADEFIDRIQKLPRRIRDLMTEEERRELDADLAEMVRIRRRAEVASRNMEMP